jgi:hypothetical protein
MLVFSSLSLLSVLAPALAAAHAPAVHRSHHEVAKRMEGTLAKRASGVRMTFYGTDTGGDACTGHGHSDNDWVIAISTEIPNAMSHCNKKVKISYQGKSTVASVIDLCASCSPEQIDLTKGLFQFFAPLDKGIFYGDWEFTDGGDSGGNDNKNNDDNKGDDNDDKPPPPKKTTKAKPKPTPTPKEDPKPQTKEEEKKETEKPKTTSTPEKKSSSSSIKASTSSAPSISVHVASAAPSSAPPKPTSTTTVDGGVGNAGADPTSGLSGGIGSGSDNGASSHTTSKAVIGVSALILLAVQAL